MMTSAKQIAERIAQLEGFQRELNNKESWTKNEYNAHLSIKGQIEFLGQALNRVRSATWKF